MDAEQTTLEDPEPRWPAVIAALSAGSIYTVLPESLSFGPNWLLPAIVFPLTVPTIISHRRGAHKTNKVLGHLLSAILTGFLAWSVVILVYRMATDRAVGVDLLRSAGVLWGTNILVFALWYWRLDAGGPHVRDARAGHDTGAFLFPQMQLDGLAGCERDGKPWSPRFIDYLFLAFNTSTAFSPTDVPVLSRWAKVLVMAQSLISLSVIVILTGRAVNIL